jgi:3-isopropylmalate/(R)-2-methylmalate dehydratase large subunit
MTIVCGDSHTSTHGAFGALAFGIGTTEVGHVLATQSLLQRKPKSLAISVAQRLHCGVTAKDLILWIIGRIGVAGGAGHVIEYRGAGIRALDMEERMTVCNMSIEAGARAGMIAPDETTYDWLATRPRAPQGEAWQRALERWRQLPSDAVAHFDREIEFDAAAVEPMITYGTNPGMVMPVNGTIPAHTNDPAFTRALAYMGFEVGAQLKDRPSTSYFSAAAPTDASRICAPPRKCCAVARSRAACRCSSCPARRRSRGRRRPKACTVFSSRRARSGANRVVRCAWE